jgi:hypothetical protein
MKAKGGNTGMFTFILRTGLATIALFWAVACPPETLARVDRLNVKVGDSTVFRDLNILTGEARDTSLTVVSIDASKIVSQTSGATSGARTFTRDFNPMEFRRGDVVAKTFKPYWPYLQFPLEVGRQWDIPFEVNAMVQPDARYANWQWKARGVAAESVTVPAGTLRAFRIEYEGSFATQQGGKAWLGKRKETAWFVPALSRIVKHDYEQTVPLRNEVEHHRIELVSFKLSP